MSEPALKIASFFCEDVRQEVHGKVSIMGVLRGYLALLGDSQVLPKLVAMVWLECQRDSPPEWVDVWISIEGGTDTPKVKVPLGQIARSTGPQYGIPTYYLNVPIELMVFEAKVGMKLQVHAATSESQVDGDELRIVRFNAEEKAEPETAGPTY